MPTVDAAALRALFPALGDTIYLNTATLSAGCAPARDAYLHAIDAWTAGRFDWTEAEQAGEESRALFAEIIGADADEVAIVPAVSSAAGIVAANLPPAAPGENVVVGANEFASNYFPWLGLRERGYDVRAVPAHGEGMSAEAFAAVADGGTRLIAVSAVHSATGHRNDLAPFRALATRCCARLFVDACQAAGAVPIDVHRERIDFLAASSHKFLLGARGMGYLFVRREWLDAMHPVLPGWKAGRRPMESFYGPAMELSPTASKLDASLIWFAALAERASLGIFRRFGVTPLLARNAALMERLRDALTAAGAALPDVAPAHRSTILTLPVAGPELLLARLRDAKVVAAVRGGRVRLALHFYNTESEVDRVAALVARA